MRNLFLPVVIAFITILSCSQCSDSDGDNSDGYGREYPRTREAIAIIDSCMSISYADPAQSHHIIDSVCNAELISPQRCDYYHAIVVYEVEEKRDSALAICRRLLDDGRFGEDKFLEEELCVLASNITITAGRFVETLEFANRGIAICHGQKLMNYDEAMLMGRVGRAEQMLGRTEEAKRTYAEANELLKENKTFGGLIARISLLMKQTLLYFDANEYDKVIAVSEEVLDLVEAFHRDPSSVENRPAPMATSGEDTRGFADFYQSQMYGKIARAYRFKIMQGGSADTSAYRDSMNLYLDKWEQTQSHNSLSNLANALSELYFAGRREEFNEAKEAVADIYKGDSIVGDYVEYLNLLAQEAASRRDFQSSNGYLQRALAISDSIRQQETLRMLSEQMAIHIIQQEQLARQEAEYQDSRNTLIFVIIVIFLASAFVIIVLRRRNKEKKMLLQQTQQDLIKTQEEVNDIIQQLEETKLDKSARDMQILYDRIVQVLDEKKLYLKPDFNMVMLAEELCTNRTFISACINSITGKSFRVWLAEYRLNLFLQKQSENPDAPIDQLLIQCGYNDQSTFRRQFKATFGTSPTKYKTTTE